MSLKRRVQYKFRNLSVLIKNFRLPNWCESASVKFLLVFFIVVLSAAYIIKTSAAAGTGYEMRKLEKQLEILESENRKAQAQIADYSSLESVKKRLREAAMVSVGNVKHVAVGGAVVAKK